MALNKRIAELIFDMVDVAKRHSALVEIYRLMKLSGCYVSPDRVNAWNVAANIYGYTDDEKTLVAQILELTPKELRYATQ